MSRLLTAALLCLFTCLSAAGQTFHTIPQPRNKFRLPAPYYLKSVTDLSGDEYQHGQVMTGLLNVSRPVNFEGGPAAFIGSQITPSVPDSMHNRELHIDLIRMTVMERHSGGEIGTCKLTLRFRTDSLSGSKEGFIASSVQEKVSYLDVTLRHGELLAKCLQNCINQFSDTAGKAKRQVSGTISSYYENKVDGAVQVTKPGADRQIFSPYDDPDNPVLETLYLTSNSFFLGAPDEIINIKKGLLLRQVKDRYGYSYTYGGEPVSRILLQYLLATRADPDLIYHGRALRRNFASLGYYNLGFILADVTLLNSVSSNPRTVLIAATGLLGVLYASFVINRSNFHKLARPAIDAYNSKIEANGYIPRVAGVGR